MPKGWAWSTLGELGQEVRGQVTPERGVGYALYSVPAFPTRRPELLDGSGIQSGKRQVATGDVLICKINPRINRVWIVGEDDDAQQISSTEWLVLRPHEVWMGPFIRHYLSSPVFRAWIKLAVEGATGSHTRAKSGPVLTQRVPVPPLAEQERIVVAIEEHLSRLDAAEAPAITARRRLGQLERSVLQKADDSRWPEMELGDLLVDIEAGKSFQTPGRRAAPDEWGVIKVSAMTWGAFDERENKAVLDVDRVQPRFEIQSGDLLFSRANTSELVGAAVLVHRTRPKLLLSDKSMRLRPRDEVDAEWLRYCLGSASVRDQISLAASGTSNSMRNISQDKVRRLRMHVPPKGEQRRLAEEIASQREARERLSQAFEEAARRAEALRRSLLDAAFSGRLVAQDPSDEPADVLLARIAEERSSAGPKRRATAGSSTKAKDSSS